MLRNINNIIAIGFLFLALLSVNTAAYGKDNASIYDMAVINSEDNLLLYFRLKGAFTEEIEKGIEHGHNTNQRLVLLHHFSCKARVFILMGNIEEAEDSLSIADEIRCKVVSVPWQLSNFRLATLENELYRLEESIKNDNKKMTFRYRTKINKSSNKLLKLVRKVAQNRTESYRLVGVYYWLIKKQEKALKWWNKSIGEGEGIGARLELSRTYFEVGKRLLEADSKYGALNDINAKEYLEKARVLFEEIDSN